MQNVPYSLRSCGKLYTHKKILDSSNSFFLVPSCLTFPVQYSWCCRYATVLCTNHYSNIVFSLSSSFHQIRRVFRFVRVCRRRGVRKKSVIAAYSMFNVTRVTYFGQVLLPTVPLYSLSNFLPPFLHIRKCTGLCLFFLGQSRRTDKSEPCATRENCYCENPSWILKFTISSPSNHCNVPKLITRHNHPLLDAPIQL